MGASAGAIRAGRAFVELFADDSRLVRGLRGAETKLKAWGQTITGMGAKILAGGTALAAPLVASTKVFADMGDKLAKASQRTGASVESLSELGHAAEQSGTTFEGLETGLKFLQKNLTDAAQGSREAQETFRLLGLSVSALQQLSPDQQFELIADRLAQIQDPALKTATAMKIFGRSGADLLPLMADGAKGIRALRQEARDLGLVIGNQDAQSAVVLGDTLANLWKVIKQGTFVIGAALAPTLIDLAAAATRLIATGVKWIHENRQLIVTVAKVAAGVVGLGLAFLALGSLISGVCSLFGMAAAVIGGIGTALGAIGAAAAFLVSPLGLVIAGLVGLTAWFVTATDAGQAAVARLTGAFWALGQDATAAFGGIVDALQAGDLGLAMRVAASFLKLEWQQAVAFLQEKWLDFKLGVQRIALDAFFGVLEIAHNAWAGLQTAWLDLTTFLANAWTRFTAFFTKGWNTAQNFVSKGVLKLMKLFDDSIDVESATRLLNEDLTAQNAAVDRNRDADLADRDRQRAAQTQEIERDRARIETDLADANNLAQDDLTAERNAALAAAQTDVDQARRAFEAALAESARKRREREDQATARAQAPGGLFDQVHTTSQLAKQGIGGEDVRTREGFKSVAAALRQGRHDAHSRLADNTSKLVSTSEKQYREVRRTREAIEDLEVFEIAPA
jgi:hypothetical protein